MKKPDGNWADKRPDTRERLAGRFSIHSGISDSLGGLPELTTADFSAAVGLLKDKLQQIVLGAGCGNWNSERDQLKEVVLRRSRDLWHERKREGNLNWPLNAKVVDLVLSEWYMTKLQRGAVGDTARAKQLGVNYNRYKTQIKGHKDELVGWLDMVTVNAMGNVKNKLRK